MGSLACTTSERDFLLEFGGNKGESWSCESGPVCELLGHARVRRFLTSCSVVLRVFRTSRRSAFPREGDHQIDPQTNAGTNSRLGGGRGFEVASQGLEKTQYRPLIEASILEWPVRGVRGVRGNQQRTGWLTKQ